MESRSFRFACFDFQIRFLQACELPAYKGACLHGAFGQALQHIGIPFRDYFFNPATPSHWRDAQQTPPRPYTLIPPDHDQTRYQPGDTLGFGITLFGSAIDQFMIVFAAFAHLGGNMGLGTQLGRFAIDTVRQLTPDGVVLLYQDRNWLNSAAACDASRFFTDCPISPDRIRIRHCTRLRLKAGNQLLGTAPPFSLLLHRLLSRINALAAMYCGGPALVPEAKQRLLQQAESIAIESTTLAWQDWQRYSQRAQSTMPFGGLLGETVYRGELAPFLPWLELGQWVGVGGKTSFGLGQYQLEIIDAEIRS